MIDLKELQKAQDNRPNITLDILPMNHDNCIVLLEQNKRFLKWFEDFTKKFATYRADLELPVGEWLTKNAKTISELNPRGKEQYCRGCYNKEVECLKCFWNTEKWVSVEDVRTFFLAKERSLRKRFQDLFDTIPIEMEKVGRKYEVYSVGTKKQWIAWLVKYAQVFDETLGQETDKTFVLVGRKQLSDLVDGIKEKIAKHIDLEQSTPSSIWDIVFGKIKEELLASSGEHLNLALAFSDVRMKKKGS